MPYNDYQIVGKAIVEYCKKYNMLEINNDEGRKSMVNKARDMRMNQDDHIKKMAEDKRFVQASNLLRFCRDKTKHLTLKKMQKLNAAERMELISYFECEPGQLSAKVIEFWFNFNPIKVNTKSRGGGDAFD
ncbi:MAG: hypothetical protein GY845_17495 [Planctomycetes bacterium]|nr:hypothetical protein [Planctomycetota bacterium]